MVPQTSLDLGRHPRGGGDQVTTYLAYAQIQ